MDYVTRLPNSWLREGDLARWDLVVDPAAGAWSGVAAQVLAELSPLSVREVNALDGGRVNENGGVVALEGRRVVEGRTPNSSPAIQVRARFLSGPRAQGGSSARRWTGGGLRSRRRRRQGLRLVYNPFRDALHVLDGDDALVLQSAFPERRR